ncbi:hypothetical protein PoB_005208800 [Plakobranchus ocellatus]|uniref:Uncharacterized protein n=1 Tax=Plakobranchus ocellatus TaxID=259542 RepID=A0AAV4C118_9GAST|nr:hypothetical protein PoB_005208800 [Plakobranchus ocellatus]
MSPLLCAVHRQVSLIICVQDWPRVSRGNEKSETSGQLLYLAAPGENIDAISEDCLPLNDYYFFHSALSYGISLPSRTGSSHLLGTGHKPYGGVGGTVDSESVLKSAGILLS